MKDKVSIIVPVYNSSKTLKKCLNSIINQTYKNIEILCINDGSVDNSVKIIKDFKLKDNRVKLIDQKINKGVAFTKNNGIKKATGQYISFVDSDDYIDKNMIKNMIEYLKANDLDIVKCHYDNYIDGICHKIYLNYNDVILTDSKDKNIFINDLLSGKIPGYMQLLLIDKNFMIKNNISMDININFLEDLLFYIKLFLSAKRIGILSKPLYHYVNNTSGLTFSISEKSINNRLNGIEYYNTNAKKMLNSDEQVKILDTRCCYMLIHTLYEYYTISKNNKNKCIEIINKPNIKKIFENADSKNLDKFSKIAFKNILNENYKYLFALFAFTKFYLKLKNRRKK